jgi:hypothetical protein
MEDTFVAFSPHDVVDTDFLFVEAVDINNVLLREGQEWTYSALGGRGCVYLAIC